MQEELKKRLQELELQMQAAQMKSRQAIAEINAVGGAIQEVKYWMEKFQRGDKNERKAEAEAGD